MSKVNSHEKYPLRIYPAEYMSWLSCASISLIRHSNVKYVHQYESFTTHRKNPLNNMFQHKKHTIICFIRHVNLKAQKKRNKKEVSGGNICVKLCRENRFSGFVN